MEAVQQYLRHIEDEFKTGHAQEHSYRPALKAFFEAITKLRVVNEPKGSAHGRPDFIFVRGDVPIAWSEAKDLHVNLEKIQKSEQMARYYGYPNLILTNGLEFRFFRNGQPYGNPIIVATKHGDAIVSVPETHELFARTLADFVADTVDTIRSAEHLAKIMGGKARRLRDNIVEMLDPAFDGTRGDIMNIMDVLKTKLIHDLSVPQFADLYAQTLVYGLFVARYYDDTPDTFSRAEARDKIPASNHLLQQFFDHIAGTNFEKRLSFIVDELCDVFVHSNVHDLVHGLYQQMSMDEQTHDPIIHFYEDFLREYDPKLRMDRGVFYTPLPIVRYIVRSVDALLKEHFGLVDGLADRSTIEWTFTEQGKKSKRMIDRVQMLDPAVGTGTFLNEIVRTIHKKFEGQEGSWPAYVNDHLILRLHGFELMMASYTIAHLKLGMTLAETGVKNLKKRLRIFLTNSLEEAPEKDDTLFASLGLQGALTEEAQLAHEVKRDYPIMVVLGNPPYSVSSQNASVEIGTDGKKRKTWIGKLLDDYKKDLNEKKLNLDDDYIKFLRFSHHLIEKNGQGIIAMITNNSFVNGLTHRRMRECLIKTFDDIYLLDLHGDSKRKEKAPDGGKDEK
ncbi:N-6 DNA methylase [Candidatus Peregrinibacteria bacterium]|nr:N-6 DNA methylase [Candidatus Peregrinibacteria bacterium]MBI3816395.1 N-6 DNA methylase [Candidatus Peregrinibacteria bacterium]